MNVASADAALTLPAPPALPAPRMPKERLAKIAARRAFVEMKQSYMDAAADIAGATAERLLHRVRQADEPWELWSLRALILASLSADHERTAVHRMKLEREFDSLFSGSHQ